MKNDKSIIIEKLRQHENGWPHKCESCPDPIEKEDAIDIGPDKNGMPIEWYNCPTCGNTFTKLK